MYSGAPARSPGGSPSKSQATLIMCGIPTCKFAFLPKSMCVPKNPYYLSKINSKKDSASWRDLVTLVLPDSVRTVQEPIGTVSVREQGPIRNIKHASGSSVTPTLDLRLKMQMGSIPTHWSLDQLKAWREKNNWKSNEDPGGTGETSVSIWAPPPNIQWLSATQFPFERLLFEKQKTDMALTTICQTKHFSNIWELSGSDII